MNGELRSWDFTLVVMLIFLSNPAILWSPEGEIEEIIFLLSVHAFYKINTPMSPTGL